MGGVCTHSEQARSYWVHRVASEHPSDGREVWGPAPGVLGQDADGGGGFSVAKGLESQSSLF